jgi:hypothetical protein
MFHSQTLPSSPPTRIGLAADHGGFEWKEYPAASLRGSSVGPRSLCLLFNTGGGTVDFGLPPVPAATHWYLAVDTSREVPQDRPGENKAQPLEGPRTYCLSARSSAILLARRAAAK